MASIMSWVLIPRATALTHAHIAKERMRCLLDRIAIFIIGRLGIVGIGPVQGQEADRSLGKGTPGQIVRRFEICWKRSPCMVI